MRWPGRDISRQIRRATFWASLCAVLSAAGLAFALVSAVRAHRAHAALLALEAQPLCQPDAPPGTAAGAQCRPTTSATVAATRHSRGRSGRRLLDLVLDGGRRVSVTVSDHDGLYDRLAHGDRVIAVVDGENVSEVRTLDAGGAPGGRILTRGSPHREVTNQASAVLLGLLAAGLFGLPAADQAARRRALQRAAERPAESYAGDLSLPYVARATWRGTLICAFFAVLGVAATFGLRNLPLSDPNSTGLAGPVVVGLLIAAAVAIHDRSRRVEIAEDGLTASSFLGSTRVPYRDITEVSFPSLKYGHPLRIRVRDREQPHDLPIGSFSRRDRARIVHAILTRRPGLTVDTGVLELLDGTAAP